MNRSSQVAVYTDSFHVKDRVTKWTIRWKQRSWTTADKKPMESVVWRWVKGHSGDPGIERADRLASLEVDSVLQ